MFYVLYFKFRVDGHQCCYICYSGKGKISSVRALLCIDIYGMNWLIFGWEKKPERSYSASRHGCELCNINLYNRNVSCICGHAVHSSVTDDLLEKMNV